MTHSQISNDTIDRVVQHMCKKKTVGIDSDMDADLACDMVAFIFFLKSLKTPTHTVGNELRSYYRYRNARFVYHELIDENGPSENAPYTFDESKAVNIDF